MRKFWHIDLGVEDGHFIAADPETGYYGIGVTPKEAIDALVATNREVLRSLTKFGSVLSPTMESRRRHILALLTDRDMGDWHEWTCKS